MIISKCFFSVEVSAPRSDRLPLDVGPTWPTQATGGKPGRKPTGRLLPSKMRKNGGFQWCKHEKSCENGDFSDLNIKQCGFHWTNEWWIWSTKMGNNYCKPTMMGTQWDTYNHFMKHEIAKHGEHDHPWDFGYHSTQQRECDPCEGCIFGWTKIWLVQKRNVYAIYASNSMGFSVYHDLMFFLLCKLT